MHYSNTALSTVPEEGPSSQFNSHSQSMMSSVKARKASMVSIDSISHNVPQMPKLKPWQLNRSRPRQDSETIDIKRKLGPQNVRFVYSEAVEKELRKRGISLNVGRLNGWTNQIQFIDNCNAEIDQFSDIHNEADRRMRKNIAMAKGRWSKSPARKITARKRSQVFEQEDQLHQESRTDPQPELTTSDPGHYVATVCPTVSFAEPSAKRSTQLAIMSSRPKSLTALTQSGSDRLMSKRQQSSDITSRTPSPDRPQRPWKIRGFTRYSVQPVDNTYSTEQLLQIKLKLEAKKKPQSPIIIPEPLPSVTSPKCFLTELIYRPVKELTRPQVVYKTGRIVVFTPKGKPLKDTRDMVEA